MDIFAATTIYADDDENVTPKTDSDGPDGLRITTKCWLNYNP